MSARMNALDTLYNATKRGVRGVKETPGAVAGGIKQIPSVPVRLAKAAGATMGGRSVARLKSRKP